VRIDGAVSEIEALAERGAEKIYAQTQPYRYAFALAGRNRPEEAQTALRALAVNTSASATERAWAYSGLSVLLFVGSGDRQAMKKAALNAIQTDPDLFEGYGYAGLAESTMGHEEAAYQYYTRERNLLRSRRARADVDPTVVDSFVFTLTCNQGVEGDVAQALLTCRDAELLPQAGTISNGAVQQQAQFMETVHDNAGARSTVESMSGPSSLILSRLMLASASEDWSTAARLLPEAAKDPIAINSFWATAALASGAARAGDLEAAQKLIDATPTDCYGCLRARGQIAALKKDWPAAERWFSEAAKQGPSLPFANTEWGQMLLDKGDSDRAIAQFEEAVKRQPHFADPYQYWGEALLAKGDARSAITKFEAAVKYAPKWGRIQIQWGAALKKLGRNDEAQKKFAAAEALELIPSEKALLAQVKGQA
jgi:tetratricopeptide (TPR) repeat protein